MYKNHFFKKKIVITYFTIELLYLWKFHHNTFNFVDFTI